MGIGLSRRSGSQETCRYFGKRSGLCSRRIIKCVGNRCCVACILNAGKFRADGFISL